MLLLSTSLWDKLSFFFLAKLEQTYRISCCSLLRIHIQYFVSDKSSKNSFVVVTTTTTTTNSKSLVQFTNQLVKIASCKNFVLFTQRSVFHKVLYIIQRGQFHTSKFLPFFKRINISTLTRVFPRQQGLDYLFNKKKKKVEHDKIYFQPKALCCWYLHPSPLSQRLCGVYMVNIQKR